MTKEQFAQILDKLIAGYNYSESSYQVSKSIALESFDKLSKRRPFLFTITNHHKDDTFINTELFYLEVGEKPADFLKRAYQYIRNIHGSGCTISKQEIRC